ncbi:MBL fold metallo-hydrolase, partial [Micromonospora zhanjiangensis]
GGAARAGRRRTATAALRWFGTSGWRVDIGDRTLLVDPYLSRYDTGLFTGGQNPATRLTVDPSVIDPNVGRPENILVTHSHWDHLNDVPYIATVRSRARVFGTLTTYHLAAALDVPTGQLAPVKGGEVLDFGDYTVEVVASLHSRNRSWSVGYPGVRLARPPRPETIADLPEGDTLAYAVQVRNGPKLFFMGASDFVARNLAGLAPDVAMIAYPATDATADYLPRLMAALDRPAVVVPVHWDNFEVPLHNPPTQDGDPARFAAFVESVRRVSPRTRVIVPEYLTTYRF